MARRLRDVCRNPSMPLKSASWEYSSCKDRRGTLTGYQKHAKNKSNACVECRRASREHSRQVYAMKRKEKNHASVLMRQAANAVDFAGIYVVTFDDGTLKVGRSKRVNGRIGEHAKDAKKWDAKIEQVHATSLGLINIGKVEKELRMWCSERASLVRQREYFEGVDFAEVAIRLDELVEATDGDELNQ